MALRTLIKTSAIGLGIAIAVACSSDDSNLGLGNPGNAGGSSGASGNGGSSGEAGSSGSSGEGGSAGSSGSSGGSSGSGGSGIPGGGSGGGGGNMVGCSDTDQNSDNDMDGWSEAQGDCNDCDPNTNPGALDILNYKKDMNGDPTSELADNQIDEDCSGAPRQPADPVSCDDNLNIGDIGDPFDAAKAMELCNKVEENPADPKERRWGVISAAFSDISGPFLQTPPKASSFSGKDVGVLDTFGVSTPQAGKRVFALSSGIARAPGQPGYQNFSCTTVGSIRKTTTSAFPDNSWPKQGTCGTTGDPNDGVALDLKVRVPTNAKSMSFKFRFFSCEFPKYLCSTYNDVLAVLMSPSPLDATHPMAGEGNQSANIAFESAGMTPNVIGVNNQSFFTACNPSAGNPKGYTNCVDESDLSGTNFEGHGASAWLKSTVPVVPGSIISLRIAIWDSRDTKLDTTAIVDSFEFSAEEGMIGTVITPPPPK